jgi:ABC-2 type transport system permease protein
MKVLLGNILAIYRKELQSYFASPFAYVIAGIFWLICGLVFYVLLLSPDGIVAQIAIRDQSGITDPPIDVPYQFLSAYLGVVGSFTLFLLPMLSMGLYSEERKRGTLELLATSPVSNWVVAVGKLLGVITFFITMVVPLMVYQTIALVASDPPIQMTVMVLGHVGLILMAAAVLSLGMFISSLTDSTILAAILTFGVMLFLWIVDAIANAMSGPVGEILAHLSLLKHYTNLVQGVLDAGSVALLLSYVVLGLFLTAQSVEALRFQRS